MLTISRHISSLEDLALLIPKEFGKLRIRGDLKTEVEKARARRLLEKRFEPHKDEEWDEKSLWVEVEE